jgi:hypothetical protein
MATTTKCQGVKVMTDDHSGWFPAGKAVTETRNTTPSTHRLRKDPAPFQESGHLQPLAGALADPNCSPRPPLTP